MNVSFYNRHDTIWINVRYKKERVRLSTDIPLAAKYFDKGKIKRGFKESLVWINALDQLKINVQRALLTQEGDLKAIVLDAIGRQKIVKHTILTYLSDIIKERRAMPNFQHDTLSPYLVLQTHFTEFCKGQRKQYNFTDFAIEDFNKFLDFLMSQEKPNGQPYAQNTIQKVVARLKFIFREAYEAGLHKNDVFRHSKFAAEKVESDSIYLTKFEIQKMATVELDPSLDKVRDLFIIACHTGLRFSDFSVLTKENIVEQESSKGRVFKAFKVKTQKTGALVQIPLSKEVERILEKYNGIPPKAISNQKMNFYLKIIAEKAGIINDVIKEEIRGGEKIKVTFKKCELVTCHTARRTFATNAVLSGVPTHLVMAITAHTTESSFKKYVKYNSLDASRIAADEEFFN